MLISAKRFPWTVTATNLGQQHTAVTLPTYQQRSQKQAVGSETANGTQQQLNPTSAIAAYWGQRPPPNGQSCCFLWASLLFRLSPPGGDKSMAPCQQIANIWEESVSHPRLTSGLRHSPEPMAIPSSLGKVSTQVPFLVSFGFQVSTH